MKYIVTIGREYGSGGRFIARLVAEKLGISFYDNELLAKAAEDSGMSVELFKTFDEKKNGLSIGLGMYSYDMSLSQKVFIAQFDAIKSIAETESCVIVGRCADYVLKDMDNVANIFICAPMEDKVKRAIEYYNIDADKAESIILKTNKKRKAYYNFFTDREWGKAQNYDLCINSKVGIEQCVDSIVQYIKGRFNLEG